MSVRTWIADLKATSPDGTSARISAIVDRISALTPDAVKREVECALQSDSRFMVDVGPPDSLEASRLVGLPPIAREFFLQYKKVESNSIELGRDLIVASPRRSAFVSIGVDSGTADVLIDCETDRVVVVDDGDGVEENEDVHQSIWHYLLYIVNTGA